MKKIADNLFTFFIALLGLCGGIVWGFKSGWDFEPIILCGISFLQILSFTIIRLSGNNEYDKNKVSEPTKPKIDTLVVSEANTSPSSKTIDRNAAIESKKGKLQVLFIDDDTKFKVVKILKDSGWKNTKTISDIKSLDLQIVKDSDLLFVDINGVGKLLNLEFEGLDLALMLKQKYKEKKVIIYSAKRDSNSFHAAWDVIDFKLEKNALPYQFQNLVEKYSLEYYN